MLVFAPGPAALAMGFALALAATVLIWAAVGDVRFYRIPNRIPVILGGAFGLMACFMTPAFFLGGLATGVAVLALGAVLFVRRWMGGGDVKLLAAAALWCGPGLLTPFALVTSLAGAALAAVMLSPLRRLLPAPPDRQWTAPNGAVGAARQPVPFGVAIAAGGLWVLTRYLPLIP